MKKINYLLLVVIVALSGFLSTSCTKQATEVNLVVRNWTLQSKTIAGVSVETTCEDHSRWNFKSDGTYAITDACNNTQTGIWKLAENGTTLTLNNVTVYSVVESTLSKLVIELQVADIGLTRWSFN